MIFTGSLLLVFIIFHVWTFKFGPGISEGYVTIVNEEPARDLYRLVVETFKNPLYVVGYSVVMILLGLHLRHGFWSAFQSLGAIRPSARRTLRLVGSVIALLLTIGFLSIPIYIYLFV